MDDALKNQASEQKLGEKETKERIRYRQNNYFTALPFDFPATPCGYPPCPRAAAAEIYFTERERERESLLRELGYCAKGKKMSHHSVKTKKRQMEENVHAYLQVFQLHHPDMLPVPNL